MHLEFKMEPKEKERPSSWKCALCIVALISLKLLLIHMVRVHEEDVQVACGLDGCNNRYSIYSSLRKHINRHHSGWLSDGVEPPPYDVLFTVNSRPQLDTPPSASASEDVTNHEEENVEWEDEDSNILYDVDSDAESQESENDSTHSIQDPLKRSAASFLIRLKEQFHLPQTAINEVIAGWEMLYEGVKDAVLNQLHSMAENGPLTIDGQIGACLDDIHPFEGLSSEWLQQSYFKENFNLLEPQRREFGPERAFLKGYGSKRRLVTVKDAYYYIPLKDTLSVILSDEEMVKLLYDNPTYRSDDKLEHLSDGAMFHSHPIISINARALQLVLYSDEIELVNAIGNSVKKHKLLMIYYTFHNMPKKCRSKLSAIHLYAVVKSAHINNYGFDTVLQPLILELLELAEEDSTIMLTNGNNFPVQVSLMAYIGDTPAANQAGGFKEGVGGAFRKCRHCECDENSMQNFFFEEDFQPRTLDRHLQQCQTIDDAASDDLAEHYKTTYGINRKSILCQAPHFDVCQQIPPDIMHVLLEGVVPYTIQLVLHHFIYDAKSFTLEYLNDKISGHDYNYLYAKSKPNTLQREALRDHSKKLRQTADQTHVLFRVIPFLIVDKIDTDDDHWRLYKLLMSIASISFATVVSVETVATLKQQVAEYLTLYKELFPDYTIKPKQHYMIHFPRFILMLGPLKNLWAMRFEAKHSYFKGLGKVANFKNICYSIAKRQLNKACSEQLSGNILSNNWEHGQAKSVEPVQFAMDTLMNISRDTHIDPLQITCIESCRWVALHGSKYVKKECVLLIDFNEDGLPVFGELQHIYLLNNELSVLGAISLDTVAFNEDLNAFQVNHIASGISYYLPENLPSHEAYHITHFSGQTFIPQKGHIDDIST